MTKDSLIVLSGGMDSVSLLYVCRETIALAVTFDYGSNHAGREIAMARENCRRLGIEHLVIPLDFMSKYFKSALLEGADAIPDADYATENMTATVVPFTNLTKADIARQGSAAGADFSLTYSCYKGGEHHCGKCATCRERRQAFVDAGLPDPTVYD